MCIRQDESTAHTTSACVSRTSRTLSDSMAVDTSAFLGVPVATLHQWRYLGTGPKAHRVGRWLRYDPAEVVAWVKRDVT